MRKLLLWLGSFLVGGYTFFIVLGAVLAPSGLLNAIVAEIFILAIGMALSAPFYLTSRGGSAGSNPPLGLEFRGWLAIFLIVIKLLAYLGFIILNGLWRLIFTILETRTSQSQTGVGAGAPAQQPVYPPPAQQPVYPPPTGQPVYATPTGQPVYPPTTGQQHRF